MVISESKKFIFVHIGKTGGRSVSQALEDTISDAHNIQHMNHATCSEMKRYFGEEIWSTYYKYTMVRNPFDRAVSLFEFQRQKLAKQFPTLNWETFMEKNIYSMRSYCKTLYVDSSLQVNSFGRFEDLQGSFDTLCDTLEIPRSKLPHIHKTNRQPYAAYFSEEERELATDIFQDDLEEFGYSF